MENKKIGSVYFIKQEITNLIKIGLSDSPVPDKRVSALQTGSPFDIIIIGYILSLDTRSLELKFHNMFKDSRIKGEWFNISLNEALNCISADINGVITLDNKVITHAERKLTQSQSDVFIESVKPIIKNMSSIQQLRYLINNFDNINMKTISKLMGISKVHAYRLKKQLR